MKRAFILFLGFVAACGGPSGGGRSLSIAFTPMYTAWDQEHLFQIPAVVKDKDVDPTTVTWNASDTSLVSLGPDPNTGGIMLTVASSNPKLSVAGPPVQVTITAQAGGRSGSSVLTITPTGQEDDWHDGALRYNNGVDVRPPQKVSCTTAANCPIGDVCQDGQCGLSTAACTNCHGPTATMGPFNDVSHTPEQIGGFTDDELDNIIRKGVVPPGGYFDPNVLCPNGVDPKTKMPCSSMQSYMKWSSLHQWTMTDEELRGLIIYLRSLPPMPQMGTSNFGGT